MKKFVRNSFPRATAQVRKGTYFCYVPDDVHFTPSVIQEIPNRPNRPREVVETIVDQLAAKDVQFMTSHEYNLLTKNRLNVTGEFEYERQHRIEATESFIEIAQPEVDKSYKSDTKTSKLDLYDFLDEAHSHSTELLDKKINCIQRITDFAWENPYLVLKGEVKETVRFNLPDEMSGEALGDMKRQILAWLPEEYRQEKAADFQTRAAFDAQLRAAFLRAVDSTAAETKKQIEQAGYSSTTTEQLKKLLDAEVAAAKAAIDPTGDITEEAIRKTNDVEALRKMAHRVIEYNADSRLLSIFEQASKVSGDVKAQRLLSKVSKQFLLQ